MYLSYYSKPKPSFSNDLSNIQKEQGKIVTKKISHPRSFFNTDKKRHSFINIDSLSRYRTKLYRSTGGIDEQYTKFKIPKAQGGFREILAPSHHLKTQQKRIQEYLLKDCKFLAPNSVHGFVRNRNTLSSMRTHQNAGSRWFLKIDIKDFFPSITIDLVLDAMENIYPFYEMPSPRTLILPCFLENGTLPQGSPASPVLSNIAMVDKDIRIQEAFPTLTYTRYADDMMFSSKSHFDWQYVVRKLEVILLPFKIKRSKTRYGSCAGSNWNLGLMYNKDLDITVGYKQKKYIKNRVHNFYRDIQRKEELSSEEVWELDTELHAMAGLLAYYRYIEPEYFNNLIEKYKQEGKKELVYILGCEF